MQFSKLAINIVLASAFVAMPSPLDKALADDRQWQAVLTGAPEARNIHGLAFDDDDRLYGTSILGQSVVRIDRDTGSFEIVVGPPHGESDDVTFLDDGTMVWTKLLSGEVWARSPKGEIRRIAVVPHANPITQSPDGRIFTAQVFGDRGLWEVFLDGRPARKILENHNALNAFDFGPDGYLYAPVTIAGQVIRIDIDTGDATVVAEGLSFPAAVKFDSTGMIWATEAVKANLVRIDPETGDWSVQMTHVPVIDNFAIDSNDRVFFSRHNDNGVYEFDTDDGSVRILRQDQVFAPGGLDVVVAGAAQHLVVADLFNLSEYNPTSQTLTLRARNISDGLPWAFDVSAGAEHYYITDPVFDSMQIRSRRDGSIVGSVPNLKDPYGTEELDDGSILVVQHGENNVLRLADHEGALRQIAVDGLMGPMGIVRAENGAIYITERDGGRVTEVRISSRDRRVVADNLAQPEGIAVSPSGALIVAEVGARRIIAINPQTGTVSALAEDLPIGTIGGFGSVPAPGLMTDVAVTETGEIFFSSDGLNAVAKLSRRAP